MPLINITPEISYLPSVENPLSSDVVFITPSVKKSDPGSETGLDCTLKSGSALEKDSAVTWIFDVGTCSEAAQIINNIKGKKKVVISHFHPDHILNLLKIKYDELYVTKYTKRYTRAGTIVDQPLLFPDGIKLYQIPSSHSKGSLVLEYKDYAFLGDATYCHFRLNTREYNVQLLEGMIKTMEESPASHFGLSHEKKFIQPKENVIRIYKKILARRKPGNPIINVNDFFNDDGSVIESEDSLGNNVKVKL